MPYESLCDIATFGWHLSLCIHEATNAIAQTHTQSIGNGETFQIRTNCNNVAIYGLFTNLLKQFEDVYLQHLLCTRRYVSRSVGSTQVNI